MTTGDVVIAVPDDGEAYNVVGDSGDNDREVQIATDPNSDRIVDISTTTGEVTIRYAG